MMTEYQIYESGYAAYPWRIEYRCRNCKQPAVGLGGRDARDFTAICPNRHITTVTVSSDWRP